MTGRGPLGFETDGGSFVNPKYPVPDSPDDERLLRKQRLAIAFRVFAALGYDDGAAGHITARDPERADQFWVNPVGCHWSQVRVCDLLLVDASGTVVDGGRGKVNAAAFAIHQAVHEARPDVVAAAHAHSPAGRAFSSLRRPLASLNQDACAFHDDHAVYDAYGGVANTIDEGLSIAAALGDKKAAILANHGLLTVGATVDAAAWWFVSMERCCRAQLDAEAAGTPEPIPDELAAATHAQVGAERWGRFSFFPLAQRVVATRPDVLD